MATALPTPPPEEDGQAYDAPLGLLPQPSSDMYARRLTVTELDLQDSRYPTLTTSPKVLTSPGPMTPPYADRIEDKPATDISRSTWVDYTPISHSYSSNSWRPENLSGGDSVRGLHTPQPSQQGSPVVHHQHAPSHTSNNHRDSNTLSYTLQPPGGVSSYGELSPSLGRDEGRAHSPSQPRAPGEPVRPVVAEGSPSSPTFDSMGQRASGVDQYREQPTSFMPSTPRHPSLPLAGIGSGQASPGALSPPIVPLSAGPSYSPATQAMASIPISPNPRAYAQQPTYITATSSKPVYAARQVPKEEVCVECAMRDQDMADVDATSPGVWERESDAMYEDLLRREEEDDMAGIPYEERDQSRPKAKGGSLTEPNLKLWLSVNPREPSSRLQTLDQYVKSQRTLLEAEALAHARAMRESRQLDDKMRDAYSQLRRSAYELGSSASPMDDTGGVRIKAPRSPQTPHNPSRKGNHSRDITLLESGMIVEHVDIRREEKEERHRVRKDEKRDKREMSRARKSSRSSRSGADVMSVYSLQSPYQQPADSGFFSGIKSGYAQSVSARPSSVMTGGERPLTMLRAQSQASFSEIQSIGSTNSPRRSRFFGFKNLTSGWKSQDSLAPSGSMIDMHVALQREQQYLSAHTNLNTVDIGSNAPTLRLGETWPRVDEQLDRQETRESKTPKKNKGLKKIWKLVTGTSSKSVSHANGRSQSRSTQRTEDDAPLAPPPPLSYLVNNRERSGNTARRHVSTPSLQSTSSPMPMTPYSPSPPTAPSSILPSPTSSRPSDRPLTGDKDRVSDGSKFDGHPISEYQEDRMPSSSDFLSPDPDSRGRTSRNSTMILSNSNGPLSSATSPSQSLLHPQPIPANRPASTILRRDKSLPPIPGDSPVEFPNYPMPDARPQTVFTYDVRTLPMPHDGMSPPQGGFRTPEIRRQSFGGLSSRTGASTMPVKGAMNRPQVNVPPFLAEESYTEFGASPRMSFGQWPNALQSQPSLSALDAKPKKRKSRFGLTSLFSKKSAGHAGLEDSLDYSAFRTSQSDSAPFDPMTLNGNGYSSPPMSMHSGNVARHSILSKKNLDLVDQDREFVAYRYPSTDQRLDLQR